MSLPFRLHHAAEDDLVDAWEWYEAAKSGLGDRFVRSVRTTIDDLSRWPSSGAPVSEPDGPAVERRATTTGFPYVIRYRVTADELVVTAIYHQHRRPDFGAGREG